MSFVVGPADDGLRARVEAMRPAVSTEWQDAATLKAVAGPLVSDKQTDDLVILFSERRGMLAWRRELDRWPRRLVQRGVDQFVIVYPSIGYANGDDVPALAQAILAKRIAMAVPTESLESALRTILATGLTEALGMLRRALAAATEWADEGALELAPGAVFLGGRMARLAEPMLFLGISPNGVALPKVAHPGLLILVVLCPQHGDGPSRYLAELAPLFSNAERVEAFCRCADIDSVAGCFRSEPRPQNPKDDEAEPEMTGGVVPGLAG